MQVCKLHAGGDCRVAARQARHVSFRCLFSFFITLLRTPVAHSMRRPVWASAVIALFAIFISWILQEGYEPKEFPETPHPIEETLSAPQDALDHFATILTYATLANANVSNHVANPSPFQHLHAYLGKAYPAVFKELVTERVSQPTHHRSTCLTTPPAPANCLGQTHQLPLSMQVNTYTLLLKWEGTDPTLKPILLLSHSDVVPVPDEASWTHPPFSGTIADGFLWGRGALDTKVTLAAIMEALAELLHRRTAAGSGASSSSGDGPSGAAGWGPRRTIYVSIGHDEEVGGGAGARAVAELLRSR
jgi:carboxypeptidase PM20D1